MAIGPESLFRLTENDVRVAGEIEAAADVFLKGMTAWDGTAEIYITFCFEEMPFPNLAVQAEVTRRYTEGEDSWVTVQFQRGLATWDLALSPV